MKRKNRKTCNKCFSQNTKMYHGLSLYLVRLCTGRRPLRQCKKCKQIFHSSYLIPPSLLIIGVIVMAVAFLPLKKSEPLHIINWAKKNTISLYQTLFGDTCKQQLKKHWGWMYKDNDECRQDYQRNVQ